VFFIIFPLKMIKKRSPSKAVVAVVLPLPLRIQSSVLTPEQQTEVDNFRKKTTETKRDLKDLRKNLREESELLQFWTKLVNIGTVPLLVVILGVVLAMMRRRKVAAK
jgi:ABC-type uncharacterized transport system involved in gliding motility auxiliary subunit